MKKLFLLFSICAISLTMMAGSVPSVIVTKSHGGLTAIINLYNDVTYTPATNNSLATLNCYGTGFSFCRIPSTALAPTSNGVVLDANTNTQIVNAMNELIEMSETQFSQGINTGISSKTIAVASTTCRGGFDTYSVKGNWNYRSTGDGTMKLTVNKINIFNRQ